MKKQGRGTRDEGPGTRGEGPGTWGWGRFVGPGWILLAAAVATAPQVLRGTSCGHDFDFHLVSWLDCVRSWREGIVYPHWASSPNFGAGEPRFVFYPPLTWMLGAGLGLVLPWTAVAGALTFLLLAAAGLATRALARLALPGGAATVAGCAALLSGYALFTAYERSAFGELAGGFWIPLLLLLILREREAGASTWRRALDGSTAPLALVVAGAWLSNAPLGVMSCYLLAAVALALAAVRRSWAPVARAAMAAALGLGLAAVYLVPAAVEQNWVNIRQAVDDPGERIENSWLFARHLDLSLDLHDVELTRVSVLAVSMIALALGGGLVVWLRGRQQVETRRVPRGWWLVMALIPATVLVMQLPVSLAVWDALPRLRFLQFPWRWLVAVEAPLGIAVAAALGELWPLRRWLRVALVVGCVAAGMAAPAVAGLLFFQGCDEEDAVYPMLQVFESGQGFEGTDEYAPPGADNTLVPVGLPAACLVRDPLTRLGTGPESTAPEWEPGQGSCDAVFGAYPKVWAARPEHLRIGATTAHAGYLVLRLRSYPAWRVTVNGAEVTGLPVRKDGLIAVPVPQGMVDLRADWTTMPDVLAGRWASGWALLLGTGLWWVERRLLRPGLS